MTACTGRGVQVSPDGNQPGVLIQHLDVDGGTRAPQPAKTIAIALTANPWVARRTVFLRSIGSRPTLRMDNHPQRPPVPIS